MHGRADTGAGKHFEQQRVRRGPVDDMCTLHAVFQSMDARLQLRDHARGHHVVLNHIARLEHGEVGDKRAFILEILVQAVDIGKKHRLMSADSGGDMARNHVGVDVVEAAVLSDCDRCDNRNIIRCHQVVEQRAVDARDAADTTQIRTCLLSYDNAAISTGDAHGKIAMMVQGLDQFLVDLAHKDGTD